MVVDIFAPNLNYLVLFSESRQLKFVIDAPKLEEFQVMVSLVTYYFVQKPVGLLKASIFIDGNSGGNDYHRRVLELLRGIWSVKSIKVYGGFDIFDSLGCVNSDEKIVFPNLVELTMLGLLEDCLNWDAPIPSYLLGQLKSLRFERFTGGDDSEMKLIDYFLRNGNALEKLYVEVKNFAVDVDDERERDQLWKEYKFCRKLFTLPKNSPTCKVEFFGHYIRGSSDGFKDGLLACQINCSRWRQSEESED